jgi:hypothetical protein
MFAIRNCASAIHLLNRSLIQLRGNSMNRLALAALAITLFSPAIASSAIAFSERLESGVNTVRQPSSTLGTGIAPQGTPVQTLPENVDCIKDTTALNDRFDEARRQNLDLALNDRFDEARRRNLNS